MSDFITVLRETCPTPSSMQPRETHRRRSAHREPERRLDGSKIMGTWICTPGKFEVNYEKCGVRHFLDGYCIIITAIHEQAIRVPLCRSGDPVRRPDDERCRGYYRRRARWPPGDGLRLRVDRRFAQGGLIRERFALRLLAAADSADEAGTNSTCSAHGAR